MTLTIEPVRNREALKEFIVLPRRLYHGMPGYVAPLDLERRQLLDPKKNPFFNHGSAAYWIARRNGNAVGRISAQIEQLVGQQTPPNLGLFGCLDSIDDGEVVKALLRTAEDWLQKRGRLYIRGPFLLSINTEPGLLIEGHMEPPVSLFAWHPPYLKKHLQDAGYALAMRMFCHVLDFTKLSLERLEKVGTPRKGGNFAIRGMRLDNLHADMEIGRQIFNDGWKNNWGFVPASESDIKTMVRRLKPFIFSDSGFFIDVAGEPAAFVLAIPNLFEISADLGPSPSMFGWLKLLFRIWRQRYRSFRVILVGIASKYHDSILGARLASAALEELRRRGRARGIDEVVSGWVVENNYPMLRVVESLGFRPSRTYGVYERHLIKSG